jgi:hypothetical protein
MRREWILSSLIKEMTLKAYISTKGDRSVGINGYNTSVELEVDFTEGGKDQREATRSDLAICFAGVWGEDKVQVIFEDETVED